MCKYFISSDHKIAIKFESDYDLQPEMYDLDTIFIGDLPQAEEKSDINGLISLLFNGDEDRYDKFNTKYQTAKEKYHALKQLALTNQYHLAFISYNDYSSKHYYLGEPDNWEDESVGFALIKTNDLLVNDYQTIQDWQNAVSSYLNDLNLYLNGQNYDIEIINAETDHPISVIYNYLTDQDLSSQLISQIVRYSSNLKPALINKYAKPDIWRDAKCVVKNYEYLEI